MHHDPKHTVSSLLSERDYIKEKLAEDIIVLDKMNEHLKETWTDSSKDHTLLAVIRGRKEQAQMTLRLFKEE